MNATRADYGIDAPKDVRRLALVGGLMALIAAASLALDLQMVREPAIGCAWTGGFLILLSAFMIFSSKVLKFGVRDRLLKDLSLQGDEQVLDVGCGRGLALIGAAKQLTSGRAVGVDLWSAEDLSANTAEATLANAELEGVSERVVIDTGDMRALPYQDGSFDAVISMTAIHNIKQADGRRKALEEIVRVLKPGGRLAIFDIFHPFAYASTLRTLAVTDLRITGPLLLWGVPGVLIYARKAA